MVGYSDEGAKVISWGQYYTMTWPFFSMFVDEVYALASFDWFAAGSSLNPLGTSLSQLEEQMNSFM